MLIVPERGKVKRVPSTLGSISCVLSVSRVRIVLHWFIVNNIKIKDNLEEKVAAFYKSLYSLRDHDLNVFNLNNVNLNRLDEPIKNVFEQEIELIDISNILEDNAHMVLSFNTSGEISSLINFIRLKNKSRPK